MKHFLICILMILVACNKQPSIEPNSLTITAISTDFETKASETAFEAGDIIGIFIENNASNLRYETADGSTWQGFGNIGEFKSGDNVIAYYPYSAMATNPSAIEVSSGVDFMITAKTPITVADNKASAALKFKHVLSKLVVDVKKIEEINGIKIVSQDSIVVKNVFQKGVVDLAAEKVTGLTDKGDLKAFGNEIIVIPQTVQKLKIVFKMANGTFDSLAYNTPILLESGKKTTFTAISNADLYFTSTINLSSGEAQTNLPLSFYVAPGRTWTLTSSAPWLTFSATTGIGAATVKVSVKANSAYPLKPRTVTITLKDDKPSFAPPQIVMQNYVRIPTVEIAGTNWLMANLTASYQGQTTGFTTCANPQDYGMFWKWGSVFMYNRQSNGLPAGHWGSYNTAAATQPINYQNSGYDYTTTSPIMGNLGGPAGDPCQALGIGYKTPTATQIRALYDAGRLNYKYQGVFGWFFGPSATSCNNTILKADCIFLPTAGYRDFSHGGVGNVNSQGVYWSSSAQDVNSSLYLDFYSGGSIDPAHSNRRGNGFSVRCVEE